MTRNEDIIFGLIFGLGFGMIFTAINFMGYIFILLGLFLMAMFSG